MVSIQQRNQIRVFDFAHMRIVPSAAILESVAECRIAVDERDGLAKMLRVWIAMIAWMARLAHFPQIVDQVPLACLDDAASTLEAEVES